MSLRIKTLKLLDAVIGRPAAALLPYVLRAKDGGLEGLEGLDPGGEGGAGSPSILVIRPGGMGDAVLLVPALKALRARFPSCRLEVLAERRNGGILEGLGCVDRVHLYDRRAPFELWDVVRGGYDAVIDTEQWHTLSACIAYLTRAPVRAGFATNHRASLFSHAVPYSHTAYEAESFLSLVSAVTGPLPPFDPAVPFIETFVEPPEEFIEFESGCRRAGRGLVGMFAGATVPERRWGVDRFARLAGILADSGRGIVLIGGRAEEAAARSIGSTLAPGSALALAGRTTLHETAAVIASLDLVVTGDSGILHLCAGIGTPTVSLFGAGIEAKWAPRGPGNAVINKGLSCSPCTTFGYTPRCPYGVECLRIISPEEVFEAAGRLLEGAGSAA